MKNSIIFVTLALVAGAVAFWYFSGSKEVDQVSVETEEVANEQPEATAEEDQGEAMEVEQPMPAGDGESVTEMVVEEELVAPEAAGSIKEFTVDSFSFGYSMDVITVSEGDTVTINLTNSGGLHDWVVDEFDAVTDKISAGETTSVTFVADTAGTYEFYCSVGSHRAQGMVGTLVVE